jgi:hypothetical protein
MLKRDIVRGRCPLILAGLADSTTGACCRSVDGPTDIFLRSLKTDGFTPRVPGASGCEARLFKFIKVLQQQSSLSAPLFSPQFPRTGSRLGRPDSAAYLGTVETGKADGTAVSTTPPLNDLAPP